MSRFRAIEQPQLAEPHPARETVGPAPQLDWIRIERLVVSEAYQRPITQAGRLNVRRIADRFQWSRFSPVIVAPVEGGRFAIIDGQHRTTAAAMIGIEEVPCQIVLATPGEQAEAFTAINGAVTRVTRLALHRAAVAAGDSDAKLIDATTRRAGVTVLSYPKSELNQEPGETMAIGALADALRNYGAPAVETALRCVVKTRNRVKGGLSATVVAAVCAFAARRLARGVEEKTLLAFFEDVILVREADKARLVERERGGAVWTILLARLEERWSTKRLGA
jgi:hypothetical protein